MVCEDSSPSDETEEEVQSGLKFRKMVEDRAKKQALKHATKHASFACFLAAWNQNQHAALELALLTVLMRELHTTSKLILRHGGAYTNATYYLAQVVFDHGLEHVRAAPVVGRGSIEIKNRSSSWPHECVSVDKDSFSSCASSWRQQLLDLSRAFDLDLLCRLCSALFVRTAEGITAVIATVWLGIIVCTGTFEAGDFVRDQGQSHGVQSMEAGPTLEDTQALRQLTLADEHLVRGAAPTAECVARNVLSYCFGGGTDDRRVRRGCGAGWRRSNAAGSGAKDCAHQDANGGQCKYRQRAIVRVRVVVSLVHLVAVAASD
ncbi:unnamed protein product [Phytophthora fragariaefolia]|uniref:Unnamed protein product n=1 Tax=Phytophthora fragariaefolia TaxID=1490495 RepID=A0A9W7CP09_9STRA|nr:unnamed protein product [Phytophthora fragariaefolia]